MAKSESRVISKKLEVKWTKSGRNLNNSSPPAGIQFRSGHMLPGLRGFPRAVNPNSLSPFCPPDAPHGFTGFVETRSTQQVCHCSGGPRVKSCRKRTGIPGFLSNISSFHAPFSLSASLSPRRRLHSIDDRDCLTASWYNFQLLLTWRARREIFPKFPKIAIFSQFYVYSNVTRKTKQIINLFTFW